MMETMAIIIRMIMMLMMTLIIAFSYDVDDAG